MSVFEAPDGWRKLRAGEPLLGEYLHHGESEEDDGEFWVRDELVSPLPTEPYTVIRAKWDAQDNRRHNVFTRIDGLWRNKHGDVLDSDDITGFEVLAEPYAADMLAKARRETVQAVLDRMRAEAGPSGLVNVDGIAREFGVES